MKHSYRYSDGVSKLIPMDVIQRFASEAILNYEITGELITEATISENETKIGVFVAVIDESDDRQEVEVFVVTEEEYLMVVNKTLSSVDPEIAKGLH